MSGITPRPDAGPLHTSPQAPYTLGFFHLTDSLACSMRPNTIAAWTGLVLAAQLLGFPVVVPATGFPPTGPGPDSVLTSVEQIRSLSPQEARKEYPVRFRATITFYDQAAPLLLRESTAGGSGEFVPGPAPHLFVRDETGGIFVWPREWGSSVVLDSSFQAGDRVLVTGRTAPGDFAPIIQKASFRELRSGPLPEPTFVSPSALLTGQYDSRWIEVDGVVRRARIREDVLTFRMAAGREIIDVTVPNVSEVPPNLIDSRVAVEGVSGTVFNDNRQLVGLYLASPDLGFVRTLEAPPDGPFELPVQPISHLHRFDPETSHNHRVHVTGVVTAHPAPRTIYMQDSTGALRVELLEPAGASRGERVSVSGFPRVGTYRPILRHGRARRGDTASLPRPPRIASLDSLSAHLGERVRVRADLLSTTDLPSGFRLTLEGENQVVEARLTSEEALADVRTGSHLALRGVVPVKDSAGDVSSGITADLLISDPAAISVLEEAPWWTPRRGFVVAGGLIGMVLLAGGWILALRRRVREQTAHIREQMEKEQKLRKQAEQAAEAKEAFLAQMSHEIRTPLSSVVGYADLIDEDQLSGEQREFLAYLKEGSKRLKNMLESVLQFARLRSGDLDLDLDRVSLTEEVQATADLFRNQAAEKGLKFRVELPDEADLETQLDSGALQRMLTNLLSNAVKYTEEGRVAVEAFEADGTVGVAVRDTGSGIEPDQVERLIHPFEQASQGWNREHEGTGLGLAITAELVEELGGTLEIDSVPGEGTTVRIRFPRRPESHSTR